MNANTTPADDSKEYVGTPEEVGAQLFADALGPTIEAAMVSGATPQQGARMLAGMLACLVGTVSENFGAPAAVDMLRGTADNIERAVAAGELPSGRH